MLIPLVTFTLGLCLGLSVKSLLTYHQAAAYAAEQKRLRMAAETEAAAYQPKVKRVAAELAAAEVEIAHLRRQLGHGDPS